MSKLADKHMALNKAKEGPGQDLGSTEGASLGSYLSFSISIKQIFIA